MLDGLTQFIDDLIKTFSSWYDDGYLFYALVVFAVLALVSVVMFAVMFFVIAKQNPDFQPDGKHLEIIASAPNYCLKNGHSNWKWVNITEYKFECYNESENKINLNDFVVT